MNVDKFIEYVFLWPVVIIELTEWRANLSMERMLIGSFVFTASLYLVLLTLLIVYLFT